MPRTFQSHLNKKRDTSNYGILNKQNDRAVRPAPIKTDENGKPMLISHRRKTRKEEK